MKRLKMTNLNLNEFLLTHNFESIFYKQGRERITFCFSCKINY